MADWGMRVSQEGFDVKTCSDDELIMSSSLNQLKTAKVGTISGGTGVVTESHTLGFVPLFFGVKYYGTTCSFVGSGANSIFTVTGTSVWTYGVLHPTDPIKYYLFYEEY
jgi:hypothetical protein